jgi:hypothetical protein
MASLALSVGGLWAARWFVVNLPADYFARVNDGVSHARFTERGLLAHWSWLATRNVLGVAMIGAGVAMLVAPGPGMLTILAGLCLLSLPGKQAMIRRFLSNRRVLAGMNAMRSQAGVAPLETTPAASVETGDR